jgi:hypothetical protein
MVVLPPFDAGGKQSEKPLSRRWPDAGAKAADLHGVRAPHQESHPGNPMPTEVRHERRWGLCSRGIQRRKNNMGFRASQSWVQLSVGSFTLLQDP